MERPAESYVLRDYNDLMARELVAHADDPAYRASAVFNRAEAQTHLLETIERYRQIRLWLGKGEPICLVGQDLRLGNLLIQEFPGLVSTQGTDLDLMNLKGRRLTRLPAMFLIFCLIALRSRLRRSGRRSYELVFRTYFDFRNRDKDGRFREEYFGPLVDDAAEGQATLVVFRLLHLRDVRSFFKIRPHPKWDAILAEGLAGVGGLTRAFWRYLRRGPIRLETKLVYRGVDVTPLVQDALLRDHASMAPLNYYIEEEVAARIQRHIQPKVTLLPFENLPWEKAHCWVRARLRSAGRIVGFQHTGLSLKLLNYFAAAPERSLPQFPDRILTVGETLKQVLEAKAHFPSDIAVGAALRHLKFFDGDDLKFRAPEPTLKKAVVYAFSYDISKYAAIVDALRASFADRGVTVYLRMHPDYFEDDLVRALGITLPRNFVLAQQSPWPELYGKVDLVLYDDNSIGLEGILNGLKTFQLDVGEPIYDCGRMYGFRSWPAVIGPGDLAALCQALEAGSFDKAFPEGDIKTYLRQYYAPYRRAEALGRFLGA
jgi:hypothetical protein